MWVSDYCLTLNEREQVAVWWDNNDDNVHFVLDQHAEFDFL